MSSAGSHASSPDFVVGGGGSVYTLVPLNQRAQEWLDAHVDAESWQFLGRALVVEHRFIGDIVVAASNDGFTFAN